MSKNKLLNVLRDEKTDLSKENATLLKENDELRHRVPSDDSEPKRGQDDSRARSNSRGRLVSRSREASSGLHFNGSKKPAYKKKVNYDSDH